MAQRGEARMITGLAPDLLPHPEANRTSAYNLAHGDIEMAKRMKERAGKIKYGIFAWLIGLPLPIVLLALFYRGCDF